MDALLEGSESHGGEVRLDDGVSSSQDRKTILSLTGAFGPAGAVYYGGGGAASPFLGGRNKEKADALRNLSSLPWNGFCEAELPSRLCGPAAALQNGCCWKL